MRRGATLAAAAAASTVLTGGMVQAQDLVPAWGVDWAWSLPLTALTIVFHAAAVVGMTAVLVRVRDRIERRARGRIEVAVIAILSIGAIGWALAVLHGLDALIWALAYLRVGAFNSVGSAMLYSVDTLSTRGASGLDLPQHWGMMGALQAANGVLLFGISTAFLFGVLSELRHTLGKVSR